MKKMMMVTSIGGFIPQFGMNDVKLLQLKGYEVHYASNFDNLIYTCDLQKMRDDGMILHNVCIKKSPASLRSNYQAFKQLTKIIDEENIEMVHCHNPMGSVVARLAAFKSKTKPTVIYTAHGFHFYKGAPLINWMLYYTAEKLMAHLTDVIITINNEDYERACKFKLKKNGFVRKINGVGVDEERFNMDWSARKEMRDELGIPANAFHIVTAAEINTNKNQKVIIDAIKKTGYEDIYYSLCGKGPLEDDLKQYIRDRGLEDRVKLIGFRTDMDKVLQSADCFAFPSIREGLGVAAIEALLCGVPVLAANNRGTREYIINDINGYMCDSGNANEFCKYIKNLHDREQQRVRLATGCRKTALKFSKNDVAKTMNDIYEDIMVTFGEK